MKIKEFVGGLFGTLLSAVGTATQTNELLQTISLVITIIGAIISMIVIPLVNWYQKAKEDGKITGDEIKEGIDIVNDGIKGVDETIKKGDKKDDKNSRANPKD